MSEDPFNDGQEGVVQSLTQMRIYDALLLILRKISPEEAEYLIELHARGGLFGPAPHFDPTQVVGPAAQPPESG
jgi:hypothetical protein